MKHRILPLALAALFLGGTLHAQAPVLINYQGRVVVGGVNFTGTGQFKFALVDGGVDQNTQAQAFTQPVFNGQITFIQVADGGSGYTTAPAVTITDFPPLTTGTGATAVAQIANGMVVSVQVTNGGTGYGPAGARVVIAPPPPNLLYTAYWSNDSNGGPYSPGEPATAVPLSVTNGLYSVLLGDFSLNHFDPFVFPPPPLVMGYLPTNISAHPDVRLRVWFNDGVHGSQLLSPDQRLAPAAYYAAESVTSEAIHSGAVNTSHINPGAIHGTRIEAGSLDFSRFAAVGTPMTGQVLSFNGTGLTWTAPNGVWSLNATNDAYYNGGKVGIGTATPGYALDIAAFNPVIGFRDTGSGNARGAIQSVGGDVNLFTESYLNGSNGQALLKLANNGNVGIGKATPLNKLHVGGGITYDGQLSKVDSTEANVATVRAFDFFLGHTARRGSPGRALVDYVVPGPNTKQLVINFANDWPETYIGGTKTTFAGDVSVRSITIRGADVAEPFEIAEENLTKGTVVVIDETRHGGLKRSTAGYDTRVAGIVSGANGVDTGIILSQPGVNEGGQNVAISGRVYVQADATNASIKPGDLLTTSDLPGYAMKVTDHAKAQGAVIGKAMSALDKGTGMVLVLVTLQ